MPEIIPEDKVESTANFLKDHHKVAIFLALKEISQKPDDLKLTYILPCDVQAKGPIAKGTVSLYPRTD